MSNRKTISISNNCGKRKQKCNAAENQPNKTLKLEKLKEDPVNEDGDELIPNPPIGADDKLPEVDNPELPREDDALVNPHVEGDEKIEADDEFAPRREEDALERNENENDKCSEKYLDGIGYCSKNNKDEFYAKNAEGEEIYYSDENGMVYAKKSIEINNEETLVEYPITLKDGKQILIFQHGVPKYPENIKTAEIIFPKNPITKEEEYLANSDGKIEYPTNHLGEEFYRKDAEGNEVAINGFYRTRPDGTMIYPKDNKGNEFYLREDNGKVEIGALRKFEDGSIYPYYARKANGDEFYPRYYFK